MVDMSSEKEVIEKTTTTAIGSSRKARENRRRVIGLKKGRKEEKR